VFTLSTARSSAIARRWGLVSVDARLRLSQGMVGYLLSTNLPPVAMGRVPAVGWPNSTGDRGSCLPAPQRDLVSLGRIPPARTLCRFATCGDLAHALCAWRLPLPRASTDQEDRCRWNVVHEADPSPIILAAGRGGIVQCLVRTALASTSPATSHIARSAGSSRSRQYEGAEGGQRYRSPSTTTMGGPLPDRANQPVHISFLPWR